MCRIAGIVDFQIPVSQIETIVSEMCNLLKHGGPDDGGIFIDSISNVVLGNRRLSLLDLSTQGHMPMTYKNQFHITYNGEIYNYKSLKNELISLGHEFASNTDTEVILAAFAQWGVLSFSKLNGMFAFSIWDSTEKELYLVRDPSGIKPLYYSLDDTSLIFASEVRAFDVINQKKSQEKKWPVYLMAYGHLPEPVTTLNSVKPLPKGYFLKYNYNSRDYSFQSFFNFSYSNTIDDYQTAINLTKSTLKESIERQLLADAPIGVFLSGGLDSGIITSLAFNAQKKSLNTLSVYFEEKEFSEKIYQDVLINHLQCTNHNQLLLQEKEFNESFPAILNSMDLPSCDGINTWFISKYAASNGLKAVLSGLGGDELFGGYPSFNRYSKAEKIQQLPNFVKGIGKGSNSKKLNRMSYLRMDGVKGIYLFLRGHFTPNEIAYQLGSYENEVWQILNEQPILMNPESLDAKNKASWMEVNLYMQNQLLRDSDVMSMIHGVEIRVPFLDNELIKVANRIDPKIKYAGNLPKQFLIDCFKNEIPRAIWDRPKMGFSFPFAKWLKQSKFVEELLDSKGESARNSYKKFINGQMHWSHMMSIIILNHRNAI